MSSYAACATCQAVNRYDPKRADAAKCGRCQSALPVHGAVAELTAESLDALVRSSPLPVVIDFWAPWCGPCRSFAPTFAAAAAKNEGRVVFAKLDTEQHPGASAALGIRGIPTLIAFRDGAEVRRQSGAMPPPMLDQWLLDVSPK